MATVHEHLLQSGDVITLAAHSEVAGVAVGCRRRAALRSVQFSLELLNLSEQRLNLGLQFCYCLSVSNRNKKICLDWLSRLYVLGVKEAAKRSYDNYYENGGDEVFVVGIGHRIRGGPRRCR